MGSGPPDGLSSCQPSTAASTTPTRGRMAASSNTRMRPTARGTTSRASVPRGCTASPTPTRKVRPGRAGGRPGGRVAPRPSAWRGAWGQGPEVEHGQPGAQDCNRRCGDWQAQCGAAGRGGQEGAPLSGVPGVSAGSGCGQGRDHGLGTRGVRLQALKSAVLRTPTCPGCYNCSQDEYFDHDKGTCVPCGKLSLWPPHPTPQGWGPGMLRSPPQVFRQQRHGGKDEASPLPKR